MVTTASLWLPILLAAIGVFVASSLIHMVIKWHNADYFKLPNEDAVRGVIGGALQPGQYAIPYCQDPKEMQSPEMQKKFADGPNAMIFIRPRGMPGLGGFLGKWFLLNLVVAALAAHVACAATMSAVADKHRVFHLIAIVTFLAYSVGSVTDGIWVGKTWRAVAKDAVDALVYGVVSGAIFAWLWPTAT